MINKESIFDFALIVLMGLTIILPTGSVYGFPYKTLIVGFLLLLYIYSNFVGAKFSRWNMGIVGACIFLVWYSFVALVNNVEIDSVLSHLAAFISVLSLLFLMLLRSLSSYAKSSFFMSFIVLFISIYTIFKILLSLAIFYDYLQYYDVVAFWEEVFGYVFIGLDAVVFFRIHLAVDYLYVPVLFYLLVIEDKYPLAKLIIVVLLAGVLISYSRILYFNIFILFFLYAIYSVARIDVKKIFWYSFILFIMLIYNLDDIVRFVDERFFGGYAEVSDITRVQMYDSLLNFAEEFIVFGGGLGSHADFIRYDNLPWYYELQWLSFVGQFGLFGTFFLFCAVFFPAFYFKVNCFEWNFLFLVYISWVLVGIFNGFMLTSSAGIVFGVFVMLFFMVATRFRWRSKLVR